MGKEKLNDVVDPARVMKNRDILSENRHEVERNAIPQSFPEIRSTGNGNEHGVGTTADGPRDTNYGKKTHVDFTTKDNSVKCSAKVADQTNNFVYINDVESSSCSSDIRYEKLNKLDENPQYDEIFPPNMQDIFNELSDSAENMLEFSRLEMETRSEPGAGYTDDDYDEDTSGYLKLH